MSKFKLRHLGWFSNTVLLLLFSEIMHWLLNAVHIFFMQIEKGLSFDFYEGLQQLHFAHRCRIFFKQLLLKKSRIIWYITELQYFFPSSSFGQTVTYLYAQSSLQSLENVWSSTKTDAQTERYETLSHFTLVYGTSSIVIYGSHTLVENYLKCLILSLQFWHLPLIFVLLKLTCLVTLFDCKLQVFKNSPKLTIFGIFL